MNIIHVLYIGIGGFFGAIARFAVTKFFAGLLPSFPLGTLVVNTAGTFVLGLIIYCVPESKSFTPELRSMLTTGFLGALTTMSAFSFETFRLAETNEFLLAVLNLFLNISLCLLAVYLARELSLILK